MTEKKLKIVGITVSITTIMFIALMFFINSMKVIYSDWFIQYAVAIAIVSGIIVIFGLLTGAISLGVLSSRGKGFFS